MIYALNTLDMSDHERREIARLIGDGHFSQNCKVVHIRDTKVAEGTYYCIYCMARVFKWYRGPKGKQTISFTHEIGESCLGSDDGLRGIANPYGITFPADSD